MDPGSTIASDRAGFSARQRQRQDKTSQILRAATEIFLEEGFAATSMDKIVERAGVSKRTLYNYYRSKDEVFVSVMRSLLGSIFDNFSPQKTGSTDLAEQLRLVGTALLRLANAPTTLSLFRIIASEAQRFPRLAAEFFEQSFENVIEGIASILARENDKSGTGIADTRQAGEYYLDLLTGTAYLRVVFGTARPMGEKSIRQRIDQALHYFFDAYGLGDPTGDPPGSA